MAIKRTPCYVGSEIEKSQTRHQLVEPLDESWTADDKYGDKFRNLTLTGYEIIFITNLQHFGYTMLSIQ